MLNGNLSNAMLTLEHPQPTARLQHPPTVVLRPPRHRPPAHITLLEPMDHLQVLMDHLHQAMLHPRDTRIQLDGDTALGTQNRPDTLQQWIWIRILQRLH